MAYENIITEITDNVGTIRLNRGKYNPLSKALLNELLDAVLAFDQNKDVQCLVILGGDEVFCAGADIKEFGDQHFVDLFSENRFGRETDSFLQCRKPIIAGVIGFALGGGCELAMMCDFIIAGESAEFGQPEINLGIMAGIGGTQRLTRAVGKAKSMEMNLTGRRMKADEAERSGLVSRVVPDSELVSETLATAKRIAQQAPLAVLAIKEAINLVDSLNLREGLLLERRLFHSLFATEDKNEGTQAFVEKRVPRFSGR